MITLKEALNLCKSEDFFTIKHYTEENSIWGPHHFTNRKTLEKKSDMKKIKVLKIEPRFSTDGYEDLMFTIAGINIEECKKICSMW